MFEETSRLNPLRRGAAASILLLIALLLAIALPPPFAAAETNAPHGSSTIGDYVWFDLDGDGDYVGDVNEENFAGGIPNVVLELYRQSGATWVFEGVQTTDAAGKYEFAATALSTVYKVVVAESNFAAGGPLFGHVLTSQNNYPQPFAMPNTLIYDYKNADFGFVQGSDWGDLPDLPYPTLAAQGGPSHAITTPLRLGAAIDAEPDGQPNSTATGDDNNGLVTTDEDGVIRMPGKGGVWYDGTVAGNRGGSLQIVITGGTGVPQVFMDFLGSNSLAPVTLRTVQGGLLPTGPWGPGTYVVYFDIPTNTFSGGSIIDIPVRVRLSSAGGLAATGPAPDGEVEDYIFNFSPNSVAVRGLSAVAEPWSGLPFGLVGVALGLGLSAVTWRRRSLTGE
jgi:hypothetical protein